MSFAKFEMQLLKNYALPSYAESAEIKLNNQKSKYKLRPGEKFYLSMLKGQKTYNLITKDGIFQISNNNQMLNLFKKNRMTKGRYLSKTAEQADIDAGRMLSIFQIKKINNTLDLLGLVNNPKHLPCRDCTTYIEEKPFDQCNSENDYVQNEVARLISPAMLHSDRGTQMCVLAGLKYTGRNMKTANCRGGKLVNSKISVCRSKEYVTYITNEIKSMAGCFENISLLELIPLIHLESRFNFNAYNRYQKKINASGLMQVTQALIESQKQSFISNAKVKETPFCKNIKEVIKKSPLDVSKMKKRNICSRVEIPEGLRKSLYLAAAQYSYSKDFVESSLSKLETAYLKRGKKFVKGHERKKLLIQLTRLMHSRGPGKISSLLDRFLYDLNRGVFGVKSKIRTVASLETAGNHRIHELKNNGEKFQRFPVSSKTFLKYFSSYIFYESRYPSRGKFREPDSSRLDSEGGTFLHKLACDQVLLNKRATKLNRGTAINCGSPGVGIIQERAYVQEVGRFFKKCDSYNSKKAKKMKKSRNLCTAKKVTKSLNREVLDSFIKDNELSQHYIGLCSHHNLRGLAARPLLEFYSKTPEKYL